MKKALQLYKGGLVLLLLFLIGTSGISQIVVPGILPSTRYNLPELSKVENVPINFDLNKVKAEDAYALKMGSPMRAGLALPIAKEINEIGEWTMLHDGRMLWRVTFNAQGAFALGIVFDQFELPHGSELWIYNQGKQMVNGALGSHNNNSARVLSTKVLYGETITIEYIESPSGLSRKSSKDSNLLFAKSEDVDLSNYLSHAILSIGEIMYLYTDAYAVFDGSKPATGASAACQVDINCAAGSNWQDQKRGVAHTLNKIGNSWYYCTGSLINNTLENFAPYFLTAFHCGEGASVADRNLWQFYFNYERPNCGSGVPPTTDMITGCELKAMGSISGGSDMLLVQLNTNVPPSFNPFYNGWDKSGTAPTSGASIHHPSGDVKKISTYTAALTSASPNIGGSIMASNSAWRVVWSANESGWGVTEGGSSGSPIFDQNGLIVGTLSGGSSFCTAQSAADFYGKFSYHWESNGSGNAQQLKPWLDPLGTNPTTLRGWDPNWTNEPPVANFSANNTTVISGFGVVFTDLSTNGPTQWSWNFGPDAFPNTSNLRNPTVTWVTPGTYTVSLTVSNANGTDSKTIEGYITVTPFFNPNTNDVQIGTATTSGTFPLSRGRYPQSVALYTAEEIGTAGIIDRISWFCQTARGARAMTIYVKQTTETSLSPSLWSTYADGATIVFDGSISNSANAWTPIDFTTPFVYDGTSNLLVMAFSNASATSQSAACRFTSAPNMHQQWTGTTGGPLAGNGTVNANRPNIIIRFMEYPAAPIANFASLSSVFMEDFEGEIFPPVGWTVNNQDGGGVTWVSSSANNYTSGGSKSAYHTWGVSGYAETGWLISPQIELPAGQEYALTFWSKNLDASFYTANGNSVRISTTGIEPADFTQIWTPASVTEDWVQTTLDLSSYAGQTIYIGFRYQGTWAHGWHLDDVSVSDFNYEGVSVFEGDPLTLYDKSTNSPTIFEWNTPGALPLVSNNKNADLVYNVAGQYNVSLKAANPMGFDQKLVENFVTVVGRAPIANFIAEGNLKTTTFQPFIPIGGSVTYSDKTTRVPTGWSWVFDGGTPSSSTAQNPTITYTEDGVFDVSLTATNNHGTDVKSETNFVMVGGSSYVTTLFADDEITGYNITNGQIPGHGHHTSGSSTIRYREWAEYFSNSSEATITSVRIAVRNAVGAGKTITVTVWDGSNGVPGDVLGSKVMDITAFTPNSMNIVAFDSPIIVTGDFFVGFVLNYDTSHSYTNHMFSIFTAENRSEEKAEYSSAWLKLGTTVANAVWSPLNEIYNLETSMAIEPFVSYPAAQRTLFVSVVGNGTTVPPAGEHSYDIDTVVEVTAIPDTGWQFDGWSGHLTSTNPNETIIMNSYKSITATFSLIPYEVTFNVTDAHTGLPIEGALIAIAGQPDLFSDANGQASIILLPSSYSALVSKAQYLNADQMFTVDNSPITVNIALVDDIKPPFGLMIDTNGLEGGQAHFSWNNNTEFSEDFEGSVFPPLGWASLSPDGGTGWESIAVGTSPLPGWTGGTATAAPNGGSKMAYASWESGGQVANDQWLVTPKFMVVSGNQFSFYMRYWPNSFADKVDIRISTTSQTDPAAFNIVVATLNFGSASSTNWLLYQYNLTDYVPAGTQVFVAFREYVANNIADGAAIMLDNVVYGPAKKQLAVEPIRLNESSHSVERSARTTVKSGTLTKAFVGYNVFLDNLTSPVTFTTNLNHMFEMVAPGMHTAGVQAVYSSGVSQVVTIEFDMPGPNITFVVNEKLGYNSYAPVSGADVHFNGEVKQTDAEGKATFSDVLHGLKLFEIFHGAFFPSSGAFMVGFPHMTIPVTLTRNNTSVEDPSLADIKVFPIPARTVLNITSPENMKQLQVVNMIGQVVYSAEEVGVRHEIDVARFRDGMYMLRIITEIGVETRTIEIIK